MDSLNGAFRTLADDKDAITHEQMDKFLKPPDASFLRERMPQVEGGLEYAPFSKAVYFASQTDFAD